MTSIARTVVSWRLRSRTLELGRRTLVMGVVNITPDSFSDGGRFIDPQAAVARSMQLLDEGADLIDLGAESTRPNAQVASSTEPTVSADEEQVRLLPVIEEILKQRPDAILSVDSYKAATARAAVAAGAEIINDVSGFAWDTEMAAVCAASRCGVVLMHTRGRPEQWRTQSQLDPDQLLASVQAGLTASIATATAARISHDSLVLDPGYGFGKLRDENYALLARQAELLALGRPLLAGLSRKSFLGQTLAPLHNGQTAPVDARETASVAALVAAILHGASIVRVHKVRLAVEAALVADALVAAASEHSTLY